MDRPCYMDDAPGAADPAGPACRFLIEIIPFGE